MAKYTELQTRKLISSYGGVGSIIETIDGALMIKDFDKWIYFIQIKKGKIDIEENDQINDDRLLSRLKYYFPLLDEIVKIPANYSAIYNTSYPKNKNHIINAELFPKWFYCNNKRCNSLMHINDWYKGWLVEHRGTDAQKYENFIPPKCYKCYKKGTLNNTKKYHNLEQVRFILTAPNGNIKDIPWQKWTGLAREKDDNGQTKIVLPKQDNLCCNKQDLKYIKDGRNPDFTGVRIQCKNSDCKTKGIQISLGGLMGLRVPDFNNDGEIKTITDKDGNEQKVFFKAVIRTSNSVYYPLITNSLYLPTIEIKKEIKNKIKTLYEDAEFSAEKIQNKINTEHLQFTISQIEEVMFPENQDFIKEVDYRLKEYQYLTTNESPDDKNLVFEQEESKDLKSFGD